VIRLKNEKALSILSVKLSNIIFFFLPTTIALVGEYR
jgi:hypothetical protein